ncbi:hypothetical protein EWM64_g10722 [Hericium alpestre]|uniref:Uncharacterized protein n=1 Tax=Hericium alpestre TaxID=135208 RepID=A0A4Y9ZGI6_9AGAM|nr:hypothetical protein EWM64_g10722 [Hericium alpestre]
MSAVSATQRSSSLTNDPRLPRLARTLMHASFNFARALDTHFIRCKCLFNGSIDVFIIVTTLALHSSRILNVLVLTHKSAHGKPAANYGSFYSFPYLIGSHHIFNNLDVFIAITEIIVVADITIAVVIVITTVSNTGHTYIRTHNHNYTDRVAIHVRS